MRKRPDKVYGLLFLILLGVEILIALFVHDRFVRPYVGDMLVVVLVYSFLRIFVHRHRSLPILVFLFAAAVEFLQLFDLVGRLGLEGHRLPATVLGQTFDPADIGCYLTGALVTAGIQFLEAKKRPGRQ